MAKSGYKVQAGHWVGGKSCSSIEPTQLAEHLKAGKGVVWALVTSEDKDATANFLTKELGLGAAEVHDALSDLERPAARQTPDGAFLVAPVVEQAGEEESYIEVAMFISKGFLITVAPRQVQMLDDWLERWRGRPEEVGPTPAHLVHTLLDSIVDDYFPIVDALQIKLDAFESEIFMGKKFDVREGLSFKRRLLELRRRIAPLRDVVNGLLRRDLTVVSAEVRPMLQDVYDHTLRVLENLDVNRDMLSSILDAHLSVTSNRLNEVMRVLTVISTLLMTNSMIAGIYGMNFKFMPELAWPWGYPAVISLMALASAFEWMLFRRKGWV